MIINDAVQKGWRRIHLHSCKTALKFGNIIYRGIANKVSTFITGFARTINANPDYKRDTADEYLCIGCPQKCKRANINCAVRRVEHYPNGRVVTGNLKG
jgi:hypothetical protein